MVSSRRQVRHGLPRHLGLLVVSLLAYGGGVAQADDWPQWLGPQRDGVWREKGILDKFPAAGLKARWRVPAGAGYSGPAVAGGRVYHTDRILAPGVEAPQDGFAKTNTRGTERVVCFDEKTGKELWKHEYDCTYKVAYPLGPRTTPIVHQGKVYTLGTMGDLKCLDADSGKELWSKNFVRDYDAGLPMWGFAASPLVDGDKLICLVGGEGSVAVAFHKDTGKEIWRALSAPKIGYAPPMIFTAGGTRQLIIWHPDAVNGLNPDTGAVYWSQPFKVKNELTVSTPRLAGDLLFVTAFYDGSMMLRLDRDKPRAEMVWKGKGRGERTNQTDGLHSIMPTPFIKDGYIYGICSYGQLRCLTLKGERIWETFQATGGEEVRWGNAFLVEHEDRFFLFNEKGDLIIARLSPKGYEEVSRTHLVDPSNRLPGRPVVWSHPAFANRSVYVRNDRELACFSLAAGD
jgi:outer membrane protein assembly factor BamB